MKKGFEIAVYFSSSLNLFDPFIPSTELLFKVVYKQANQYGFFHKKSSYCIILMFLKIELLEQTTFHQQMLQMVPHYSDTPMWINRFTQI